MSKNFVKQVESLERMKSPRKKHFTVLCDDTQVPKLYEICGENRFLNELEFQKWQSKLAPNSELLIVKIYLNKPGEIDDAGA